MTIKQIALQPAYATPVHFKEIAIGMLFKQLSYDDDNLVVDRASCARLRTMIFLSAKSKIPNPRKNVGPLSLAFIDIADYIGCRNEFWFKGYMNAIEMPKMLSPGDAEDILGLQIFNKTAVDLLEDIEAGTSSSPDSDIDRILGASFHVTHSIVPETGPGTALSLCFEILSMLKRKHEDKRAILEPADYAAVNTMLNMSRARMSPCNGEGTSNKGLLIWTESETSEDDMGGTNDLLSADVINATNDVDKGESAGAEA